MELEFTSIDHGPSFTIPVFTIIGYTIWFVFFARRARHTAGLATLTLPPLLLGTFTTWIGYANILRGMAISGSNSRVVLAAGTADALTGIRFGAGTSLLCTIVALIVAARRRDDSIGGYPRSPIAASIPSWLAGFSALLMPAMLPGRGSFRLWNVTLLAAFLCLALLCVVAVAAMLGHRYTVSRRNQLVALGITLSLAAAQTVVAWLLVEHYTKIAKFG